MNLTFLIIDNQNILVESFKYIKLFILEDFILRKIKTK